jgi:hypothetical protein
MSRHARFTVQGKPFLSLGGQTHNSSSYFVDELQTAWKSVKAMGGNTVATPMPWDAFEPVEGQYNRKLVTDIIDAARAQDLHLVFLWFATWKNATMEYCPGWVKLDQQRFPRVQCRDGNVVANLSPHYEGNRDADARAFCELMRTLKDYDGDTQTVIAVQVENEPGYRGGTRRDFSPYGEAAWQEPVPQALIDYAKAHPGTRLDGFWRKAGAKEAGSWVDVFGRWGAEAFTAWAIANYINEITARGKEIYDLFCYINVALDGGVRDLGFGIPSVDNFGCGAYSKNLDVYYCACSAVDAIAPDIYHSDERRHTEMIDTYAHPEMGWPLYVPESNDNSINNVQMFNAIGDKDCIGYHIFGTESCLDKDGNLTEGGEMTRRSFQMLSAVSDLILKYQGTGKLHAITQTVGDVGYLMELSGWKAKVCFAGPGYAWNAMDFRHWDAIHAEGKHIMDYLHERSRGLIIEVSENEFYMVGQDCRIMLNRYEPLDGSLPSTMLSHELQANNTFYLELTEGHFEDGKYVVDRVRSGDEARHGVWLQADCGVVHVVMCD